MKIRTILVSLALVSALYSAEERITPWTHPDRVFSKLAPLEDGFEFKTKGDFTFAEEPSLPMTFRLFDEAGRSNSQLIKTGTSYNISMKLKPGRYRIETETADDDKYWGCPGGYLTVEDDGTMSIWAQPIRFQLKMTPISPVELVEINELRPALKWQPVQGAFSYLVRWFEQDPETGRAVNRGHATVEGENSWTFNFDLISNRTYEWMVFARDESGSQFAYHASSAFKTQKKHKKLEQAPPRKPSD
jgi:hypothetical protein